MATLNISLKTKSRKLLKFPNKNAYNKILRELKELNLPKIDKIGRNTISLSKKICYELSTARNRNLITKIEQDKLRKTVAGFFGLSVGSHAALTWMLESRADVIKIADPDSIAPSNLNRIRSGWNVIGEYKTEVVKKQLLEINPFANVIDLKKTTYQKVKNFFESTPLLNVVIDEVDDIKTKLLLRQLAKKNKIPLISAIDVGDNVIVDVERYDVNPQSVPFLGLLPIETAKFSKLSDLDKKKLIIELVGFEKNSEKMLDSLLVIGKTIPTWPQLGATATIAGGIIATAVKKIVLGEKVISGRYFFSADDILVAEYDSNKRTNLRKKKIQEIKTMMKIN